MNDPFATTYEGERKRSQGLEQGIGTLASGAMQLGQGQQTQALLKQFGILTEEETPLTVQEIKDFAKQKGVEIKLDPTMPEEQQLSSAMKLAQAMGLPTPTPKKKTVFDAGRAAQLGAEYSPDMFGGTVKFKPERLKGFNVADISNLTTQQQIQARALARKIGGVRGTEQLVPSIAQEMAMGKSIDQIEDDLRYSGQSKDFAGPLRSAAQQIMIGKGTTEKQSTFDDLDDLKGKPEEQTSYLKRMTIKQAPAEMQGNIIGKERTIKLLNEIQGDLNNLEAMGVDTNIFTGTAEQVASKLGTVVNPEARKVATKISAAVQNYRRSMTGVQFGMPENKEYLVMFPTIGRTANFNTMNINALKEVMGGDLDNFYSLSMGEENYNKLFKGKPQEDMPTKVAKASGVMGSTKQIKSDADYNSLPSGAEFIDPEGNKRRKP